jgi:hypothetical protein
VDDRGDLPAIRASDAEREHAVVVLRDAVVQGRLTLAEFSERVDGVHGARTDRELAVLVADLPATGVAVPDQAPAQYRATCSMLVRHGAWELPSRSSWRSLFGTIDLDLSQVRLGGPELVLEVFNVFGTVSIRVPPGIAVQVEGGGLFASQVIDPPPWPAPPDAPRLRIVVRGPGGTLYVRSSASRSPELETRVAPGPAGQPAR